MGQIGFDELDIKRAIDMLTRLPKNLNERALSAAAQNALRPARNEAASKLRSISVGSVEGFSKARFIARNTRVIRSKRGYPPGAFLRISGPDVPVHDKRWRSSGYAFLLAYGSYKSGNRSWRSNGKNTGSVGGIGNFIRESVMANYGSMSSYFEKKALEEMNKAKRKTGFV